jgi:hypothetical protein
MIDPAKSRTTLSYASTHFDAQLQNAACAGLRSVGSLWSFIGFGSGVAALVPVLLNLSNLFTLLSFKILVFLSLPALFAFFGVAYFISARNLRNNIPSAARFALILAIVHAALLLLLMLGAVILTINAGDQFPIAPLAILAVLLFPQLPLIRRLYRLLHPTA